MLLTGQQTANLVARRFMLEITRQNRQRLVPFAGLVASSSVEEGMYKRPTSSPDSIMKTISPMPPVTTGKMLPVDNQSYHWKRFSAVNAVSLGFIATAVFISVFLVVAIFEKFLRRSSATLLSSSQDEDANGTEDSAPGQFSRRSEGRHDLEKSCVTGVSVLMPGQEVPTFIGTPSLLSCSHEDFSWTSVEHAKLGTCSFESSSGPSLLRKSDHEGNGTGLV